MTDELEPLVWVTGATGFMGMHACRQFSSNGWRVAATGRKPWPDAAQWGATTYVEGDIESSLLARVRDQSGSPDVIFHAAGTGSISASIEDPERARLDTVGSIVRLIEYLRAAELKPTVIYPSSCAVYGNVPATPVDESTELQPVSPYGHHKTAAEAALMSAASEGALRCAVVRYFSVFGPGLRKQLLWDVARRLADGERTITLGGSGDETRDFIHVEDATTLALTLTEHMRANETGSLVVNGGTGRGVTVREIVQLLIDEFEPSAQVQFDGHTRPGDPPYYIADTRRAEAVGFTPRWTLEQGVADYARWFAGEQAKPQL